MIVREKKNEITDAIQFTGDISEITAMFAANSRVGKVRIFQESASKAIIVLFDRDTFDHHSIKIENNDYVLKNKNGIYVAYTPDEFAAKYEIE